MRCVRFGEIERVADAWEENKLWSVYHHILNTLLNSDEEEINTISFVFTNVSENLKVHVMIDFDEETICVW